jgi:hypothetical protein
MTYNDPEKRRAYQREYYHKKLSPGGEKYDRYRAYQKEYYRENLGVDGEKHEQHLERNRAYYRENFGVGGEKHERYNEKHRNYNMAYQKREKYKVGKRKRDNAWYQREKEGILEKRRQKQQPIIAWYKQYKTTINCLRCGENAPACLHLHHRNRADKKRNIAFYVFTASSLEKFIHELNKCELPFHRRLRNRIRQLETTLWFFRYKYTLQCQNCGIDHPGCLQFHHRDRREKEAEVSNLRQASIKQLLREIDKCDVLCANCHAKLHWNEHYEHDVVDL